MSQNNVNPNSLPEGFDPDYYLKLNPDVLNSGMQAQEHYINHGKAEKRPYLNPLGQNLDPNIFTNDKEILLIVSHIATISGAPILGLNLIRQLSKKYHVISLLLGGGPLEEFFQSYAGLAITSVESLNNPNIAKVVIDELCAVYSIKVALLNSVACNGVIKPLFENYVPTVGLVHEFASYMNAHDGFRSFLTLCTEVVFSTNLTLENSLHHYPDLSSRKFNVIPQGVCDLKFLKSQDLSGEPPDQEIKKVMRPSGSGDDLVVVLGVGMIEYRKGVDLFIQSAFNIIQSDKLHKFRFIWIGSTGSNPDNKNYLIFLMDQVNRLGLQDQIQFVEYTSEIETAYDQANVLFLSSRLDPLPNVAIDCMVRGIPVVCFDKTTGVVDFLNAKKLNDFCVGNYLDCEDISKKLIRLIGDDELCKNVKKSLLESSGDYYNFDLYLQNIERLIGSAKFALEQELFDARTIGKHKSFRTDYSLHPVGSAYNPHAYSEFRSTELAVYSYVHSWRVGALGLRKPMPGFNPSTYLEFNSISRDPYADFLEKGSPSGPWLTPVLDLSEAIISPKYFANEEVALHIHVYYFDIFESLIFPALLKNKVRPHLYISTPDIKTKESILRLTKEYSGGNISVEVAKNTGRDIGPFLGTFGYDLLGKYKIVGHLHTKKSTHVDKNISDAWNNFLIENLLGGESEGSLDKILSAMFDNEQVGIVYPDDPNIVGWTKNKDVALSLSSKIDLGILTNSFDFPVGTMFIARTDAIKEILMLGRTLEDDYPVEPVPIDGTVLHAIERVLPFAVKAQGFEVMGTNTPGLTR